MRCAAAWSSEEAGTAAGDCNAQLLQSQRRRCLADSELGERYYSSWDEEAADPAADGPPAALVGIIMGSDSDLATMSGAAAVLEEFGVACEVTIVSAHR